jgi:nucleoside phosphorylase/tetratricopeptide (TPR) repeat protein
MDRCELALTVVGALQLPTDFLIITALPLERDAVVVRLENRRDRSVAGYSIHEGAVGKCMVAVALADKMGNVNSATVATALIYALRPQSVLLVGIAAGLRKQSARPNAPDARRLGDVLVAEQIVAYEPAKMGASSVERRPDFHRASARLFRITRELRADEWNASIRIARPPEGSQAWLPAAYSGPVLSGEKVVANAAFLSEVRQICPTAIGLEMEGFGVASACHQASPPVDFLLIKAVCDFADEHKADDWQPYAADVAAAFASCLISRVATMPMSADESALHISAQPGPSTPAPAAKLPLMCTIPAPASAQYDMQRPAGAMEDPGLPSASLEAILGPPCPGAIGEPTQVTTPQCADAPPLPKPHVARSSVLPTLARELDPGGTVAVIGYSKSGKTSLLTEFVLNYPGSHVWLNVERSASGEEWWELALFQLASLFRLTDSTTVVVRDRLLEEADRQRVIIVIDNAHLLPDFNGMGFLEQAVAASSGRVALILAGVDEPAFVERMRSRGIATWRVPGFTLDECRGLLHDSVGGLTSPQQAALIAVRDRTDGHPGMVWLCRDQIRQIETAEDARAFVAGISSGLGTGPDAFHAALFQTFQSGLSPCELELCRRLAIALHGFSRHLAEPLWEQGGTGDVSGGFADAWDGCLLRGFDSIRTTRQQLPSLYRDGLLRRSTPLEKQMWHGIAADVLSEPIDGGIDVIDAGDAVEHALMADRLQAAVNQASHFLLVPGGRYRRTASQLLVARFTRLFATTRVEEHVDWPTVVRWYAAQAIVYRGTKQTDRAATAGHLLFKALVGDGNDPRSPAGQLGWAALMMQAAASGQVDWARAAAAHLKDGGSQGSEIAEARMRRFGVLVAYLASNANPIDGVRFVLDDRDGGPLQLWDNAMGFDFWRSVGFRVYQFIDDNPTPVAITAACDILQELADAASEADDRNIMMMALAARSRIQIDFARDFGAAVGTAESIGVASSATNARVAAFGQHALGNARRCAGDCAGGADAYRRALAHWPESCMKERAETTFMLAVCLARSGTFDEAYARAEEAASLYLMRAPSLSRLSAAHCHLEAANAALLGLPLTKVLRPLIHAHALLERHHRRSPEWVVLAQLAMQLAQRFEDGTASGELPIPGFTIGLRVGEAEGDMEPSAPTLMLGRACARAGSPYRALDYFDEVAKQVNRPTTELGVALYGLDAALAARDVVRSARFCELLVRAHEADPTLKVATERIPFAHFQISRVVSLAADLAVGEGQSAVASAANAVQPVDNPRSVVAVLRDALAGLTQSFQSEEDGGLETAWVTAIRHGATNVARDVAWFWCFRYVPGRPVSQGDFLKWQWRLLWVSLDTGASDVAFLSAFHAQTREWWCRLAASLGKQSFASRIRDALHQEGDSLDILSASRDLLGLILGSDGGVETLCVAVSEVLMAQNDLQWLSPLRDLVVRGLAELVLSPVASDYQAKLDADLLRLEEAVRCPRMCDSKERQEWRGDIGSLRSLLSQVQARAVQPNTTTALLRIGPLVPQFKLEASAANYYVCLRHTLNSEPLTASRLHKVNVLLGSKHAAGLAHSTTLPAYLRYRLAFAHFDAMVLGATTALMDAVALLRTQDDARCPVAPNAREAARVRYDRSHAATTAAIGEMDGLAAELRKLAGFEDDLAVGLLASGERRKMVGMVLSRFEETEAESGEWFAAAMKDLCECMDVAAGIDSSERDVLRLRAAFEARDIAATLNDTENITRLTDIIEAYRGRSELADEMTWLEDLHARMGTPPSDESAKAFSLDSDRAIQDLVDLSMRALGLPEDRRRNLEDDARKTARSQQIQREFCRYLQPMQNLTHTGSPETMYARPTKYTCDCTLLHYRTRIETDDIDVAINAMQRTYCDGCTKRAPLDAD